MIAISSFASQSRRLFASSAALLALAGNAMALPCQSTAKETIIASFEDNADGGVTFGPGGALFGTTRLSGGFPAGGVVYKLAPPAAGSTQWTNTPIYNFCSQANCADGFSARGALIFDTAGALYGVASAGGAAGNGVVFRLTPPVAPATTWTQTVLYNFAGAPDGAAPYAGVIFGPDGALYGTTYQGGAGIGTVFKLTPPGASCTPTAPNLWCETILHSFQGGPGDGNTPLGELTVDGNGALYGVTFVGGASDMGSAFMLSPPVAPATNWTQTLLYSFGPDVGFPSGSVILAGGDLYGVAGYSQTGWAFRLSPPVAPATQWTETTIYDFTSGPIPSGGRLLVDPAGALYGATVGTGGSVYKLTPPVAPAKSWTATSLYAFAPGPDDAPYDGLTFDNSGALYGASIDGAVFKVDPPKSCGAISMSPAARGG